MRINLRILASAAALLIDTRSHTAIVLLTNRVHPTDDGLVGPLRSKVANIVASSILWNYRN
ncbi:MAG: hypothetical protein IKX71_03000 [Bacteroidales bacterium]|nr:hypothetical protein [Bacteroidales bacterium]